MKNPPFHQVALIGRNKVKGVPETLKVLKEQLLSLNRSIFTEEQTAGMMDNHNLTILPAHRLKEKADLLIVVGGDGSLLSAAHIAVSQKLPVLGINRGNSGFLTDISPNDLLKINTILEGDYKRETRFLLEMTAKYKGDIITQGIALNDIVLFQGDIAKMLEFDISINDYFVCSQRADGLIVTTPTGSTAYSLSGGGPILHPELDAIALIAMFPHTLSSRPIVVQAHSRIKINISPRQRNISPSVSNDGQYRVTLTTGSIIFIRKYKHLLHLIHPSDYNYYDMLRHKLGWQEKL
ncbi:NAD(+) kinase [Coxiella endosymbiont of Amblyomma americanum]|uniref:NAD(+) kinase n=1 Tax=Coxiella endosymbiont of Amblyomma americanum TaxID=325775 RepID=UPI0000E670B5|nr:NAD(+) kinase [Coxiella endosymbiont of Amblyomma americanum]ABI83661.1 ATP-NAD kinase [Coxiella endosymbiont of Amblyomma americanum]AUJ59048.1 NAD kinase [Coxiella-like endosymbiont of Amblyomma americanum]